MATLARPWLDKVYLVYFLIHVPVLFCVDLVPLYPTSLWKSPDAPLHFLNSLREYYRTTYNDQFFAEPPVTIPSFFALFALLELVLHLPVSLWAVARLWKGALGGKGELLMLVYGVETALTTATCMWEAYLWDPAVVSAQEKMVLLGGLYGGYLAVAVLLTADMYVRLIRRLDVADEKAKAM
ncbi:transmembrane protein 6/97 [Xylariaceae sp. FL0016]|nr:transmembrane protein 6/97 [Xylariaceae sp. FL0016]